MVEELGGPPTAGMGWAIGMERLVILLADIDEDLLPPDIYVVNRGEKAEIMALVLARRLRSKNLKVDLDSSGSSFGKQFKRADRCGAKWAMVLGDDEANVGQVRIKKLHSLKDSEDKIEFLASDDDLHDLLAILRD